MTVSTVLSPVLFTNTQQETGKGSAEALKVDFS